MAVQSQATEQSREIQKPVRSQRSLFWHKFRRHKIAVLSGAVLLFFVVLVALAPWIAPFSFDAIDTKNIRKPPTLTHIMGTDDLGRDLFTRILYGGRISLTIGVFSALVATLVGALLGAVAAFYGGWLDSLLSRIGDIFFTIPYIIAAIVVMSVIPVRNEVVLALAIGAFAWASTARFRRSASAPCLGPSAQELTRLRSTCASQATVTTISPAFFVISAVARGVLMVICGILGCPPSWHCGPEETVSGAVAASPDAR